MSQKRLRPGRSQDVVVDLDKIGIFMNDFYNPIGRPNMIFSVIGDSDNLVPRVWPRSRFQLALTYSAKATGKCWILSKGEPTKISKIVREMVEEYVYLEKDQKKKSELPIRLVSIPSKPVDNETLYFDLPEKYENGQDKQETCFINLDAAYGLSEMEYIAFRLQLERTLQRPSQSEKNAVVIVLVEGDLSAVEHVKLAVENGIPVVVIQGTGGAADLLAELINAFKEDQNVNWKVLLPTLFGINLGEIEIGELTSSLQSIKDKAYLVDVFDLQNKDEEQFAATVGELIHRAWSLEGRVRMNGGHGYTHKNSEMDYKKSYCKSVNWNREKISWHVEMSYQTDCFSSFTSPFSLPLDFFYNFFMDLQSTENAEEKSQDLLLKALTSNRTDYIETLLGLNVSLSDENINKLYKIQFNVNDANEAKQPTTNDERSVLRWVIKDIAGENLSESLFKGENAHGNAQQIVRTLLDYEETVDPRLEAACYSKRREEYVKRQRSLQAMLLWSLFSNKGDISTIIWKRVANQLYTGLVSSVILKMMSDVARLKDKRLADKLEIHSRVFKKRASQMMDTLYERDEKDTLKILDSLETVWTIQAKPICFAYEFEMYDIIAHPSSVRLMDKTWYNELIPHWRRFLKNTFIHPRTAFNAVCFHFVMHYIIFAGVLLMYSIVQLTPMLLLTETTWKLFWFEIILYLWTILDFIHDLRNVIGVWVCNTDEDTRRKKGYKFLSQLKDMWKLLGLLCFILVACAYFSRLKKTERFILARRFCALLLIFSYLRCSRVFAIHNFTGITFMFMKYMLIHLIQFLTVTIFMMIGVGIFYQALLNDNDTMSIFSGKWYKWKMWYVLYYPYYQLYGEPFTEKLGFSEDEEKDEYEIDWAVTFVAAIYLLVANILVICLITAMFTTKYEDVLQKSEMMWQYERFHIINDFKSRVFGHLDIVFLPWTLYVRCKQGKETVPVRKIIQHLSPSTNSPVYYGGQITRKVKVDTRKDHKKT